MKFTPVVHIHTNFERNFGITLVHVLCENVAYRETLASHTFNADTVDYVNSVYILDAQSPVKSVVLTRVSALDLPRRAMQDKRHFILQTDYALTVQFNKALITTDTILQGIRVLLDKTTFHARCNVQSCYLQDDQFCVMINFDITEAFLLGASAVQAMTGPRFDKLCAPFNVEYLFTKMLPGNPALVQEWTRFKQEALYYASLLPIARLNPYYAERYANVCLRRLIRGIVFDDNLVITTLAANCIENHVDSSQFAPLNDYLSECIAEFSQYATLSTIKCWARQVSDKSRWADVGNLLDYFDSVSPLDSVSALTVSSKYLHDTPVETLFQTTIAARLHCRCFGELDVDKQDAYTALVCKYFVLPFNTSTDLSAVEDALSSINREDPAFITLEELVYEGSPQWLLVRYYAIVCEPYLSRDVIKAWHSEVPQQLSDCIRYRDAILILNEEEEIRELEEEVNRTASDPNCQALEEKRSAAHRSAESIQQKLLLDWFSNVPPEPVSPPGPSTTPLRHIHTKPRTMQVTHPSGETDIFYLPTLMLSYPA